MKVRLSAEAETELETIGDRIAQDDPARAVSFVTELRQACLALAEFPRRFPRVAGFEGCGVRHRVHGNYLIFYRVDESEVFVLHVLHWAMDYGPILFCE